MKNLVSKGKRSNNVAHPKQGKSARPPERTSSSADHTTDLNSSAPSTIQVSPVNPVNLPTKIRSKRKMDAQKPAIGKDMKSSNITKGKTSAPVMLFHDRALNLKVTLFTSAIPLELLFIYYCYYYYFFHLCIFCMTGKAL